MVKIVKIYKTIEAIETRRGRIFELEVEEWEEEVA